MFSRLALPLIVSILPCAEWVFAAQVQQINPPSDGSVVAKKWTFDFYPVTVVDWHAKLDIQVSQQVGSDADLYLSYGSKPTENDWDFRSRTLGTSNESIVVKSSSSPALKSGTWWIGIKHSTTTSYGISYVSSAIASNRSGMGATVYHDAASLESGTTFRVWAPNADDVRIAGDFNAWSGLKSEMVSEGNGHWSVDVRDLGHDARYQYVIRNGSSTEWKMDPRGFAVTNSVGDSVVVDHDDFPWSSSFSTPAWNEMVIYEMHIGTFYDSPGGLPGNFSSVIQKLDDLADLGVNVIELMPICEFPGDFSWGYNYSHPFAIETVYGGAVGLKSLIDAAHSRGIAVLVDVMYNHWGPTDMDMWQFDGWSNGGWGGIFFYNDDRATTPWGDTRPDFSKGEVRQFIRDNVLMWLEEYRVDGLRWDSTSYMRNGPWGDIPEAWSLMQWVNDEIDSSQGWKISIAEDMWGDSWITKSTGSGGAGFDSQWDANFVHPVRAALEAYDDSSRNMWDVRNSIANTFNGDAFGRVIYTESHDEVANGLSRVPESIWPGNADSWYSKKRSTLGASLVLTAPGVPLLFQGQEFLEDGFFADTDPLDWSKRTTFSGIRDLYRDLIRLRRNWFNNTRGLQGQGVNVHHVNDSEKMLAFHRYASGGPGDDVIVVSNFANQSWNNYRIGFPSSGTWKVRFNSDYAGYDPSFGGHSTVDVTATSSIPWDGMPASASVIIGPYTTVIFSQ